MQLGCTSKVLHSQVVARTNAPWRVCVNDEVVNSTVWTMACHSWSEAWACRNASVLGVPSVPICVILAQEMTALSRGLCLPLVQCHHTVEEYKISCYLGFYHRWSSLLVIRLMLPSSLVSHTSFWWFLCHLCWATVMNQHADSWYSLCEWHKTQVRIHGVAHTPICRWGRPD